MEYSGHLRLKLEILKAHGLVLSFDGIDDAIRFPDRILKGHKDRLVAQKRLDDEHVLRVVYEDRGETILVITVYPGKRSRYEKDQIQ